MRTTQHPKHTNWAVAAARQRAANSAAFWRKSLPKNWRNLLSCLSCLSWFLLCPGQGIASPSSALREYKAGNYDQALKEYNRLLQQKTNDHRLHFNAGAAAYRNRQFDEAAKQFSATLDAPDLKLQGLGYYNEGNALYHVGEGCQDPKQRQEAWQKALQAYQSSMKLSPQDPDAKFNYEFVKKKLEELKQQQQSQPQNVQPSEAAKRAKAEADEAVRRREYSKALDIMEKQLAQDSTTSHYGQFIERLKGVTGVQDTAKH
jgi:tetratricopeptide (TPR) repeat protein